MDDALKAAAFFRVAIESLIGINTVFPANQISPLPTQGNVRPVEASTSITFNAPEFIYLDRFGNDLDPNDEDLIGKAYYRVRFADYSVDGVSQGIAGTREFTVTVEADMTVSWEWQVETALFVENAVDDFDLDTSFGSPGVLGLTSGGATTGAGKRFVTKEDFPQATINGFAFTGSSSEQKQRFRVRGYVIENDDSGSSRCLLLPGNNYLTHSGASGIDLTTATGSDYTIDFWARSEAEDDAADQVIFCMGNNTSSAAQIVMQTEQTAAGPRQLVLTDNDATVTLGEVNGDWNHWAIVMTPTTDELSIYRDGRLVRVHSFNSSFTFSGGDAITVGALNVGDGFSNFFEGAVENIRVWTRILTELEVRDSMRTGAYGDGYDGNLELELTFDSPSLTNIADDAGSVADFSYQNAAGLFQLSQSDPAILAALFPSFTFFFELCPEPVRTTPAYQITGNLSNVGELDLWQRVTFLWELQYKISLQVSETRFLGLPFIDTLEKCPEDTLAATWITAGEDIVVGTKFRSGDRRYTFMDIFAQTDIFEGITIDDLLDGTKDTVSTRDFAIDDLDEAGSLAFDFRRTIFRAVVPLGEGLHVADEDDKDIQLTPNLPDDALLNIIDGPGAPVNVITDNLDPASGITTGTSGRNLLWDRVGQQQLPLHPGVYRLDWPERTDPNEGYLIEFVSDFPTLIRTVTWEIEDDQGYRLAPDGNRVAGLDPTYSYTETMDPVSNAYPSSPLAHYRLLYDAVDPPPVDLNANPVDRWYFDEMVYSTAGAVVPEETSNLSISRPGLSVILFNYTLDATGVAVGDTSQEAYSVRIVSSAAIDEDTRQTSEVLSSEDRQVLALNGDSDSSVQLDPTSSIQVYTLAGGLDTSIEAWIELGDGTLDSSVDRSFFSIADTTVSFVIGVRSASDSTNPSGWFLEYADAANSYTAELSNVPLISAWQHLVFSLVGDTVSAYLDGNLLDSATFAGAMAVPDWVSAHIGLDDAAFDPLIANVDNFRIWEAALSVSAIRDVMPLRNADVPGHTKLVELRFDDGVSSDAITNTGTAGDVSASVASSAATTILAESVVDSHPEVASRIKSKLDTSSFDSGFILREVSNYNPDIYVRDADVGAWDAIFPVNWGENYAANNSLQVTWYENPYSVLPFSENVLHPNVAWPYIVVSYDGVDYPSQGPHTDSRIYIASRLGSEGVDANGVDQLVFDPAAYGNLEIYNQDNESLAGYNPNEEAALIVPSIRDQLTGDDSFNLGQSAAFALQNEINREDRTTVEDEGGPLYSAYTSQAWALVQYWDIDQEEWKMAAYKVQKKRTGGSLGDLFPALDAVTRSPIDEFGQPVTQPTNPTYDFVYPTFAGNIVIQPYPLNLVVGNLVMPQDAGANIENDEGIIQRTLWFDKNTTAWVVSGGGNQFYYKFWYPLRSDFWFNDATGAASTVEAGTPVAWLPTDGEFLETDDDPDPQRVLFTAYWRTDYPVLKRGETLTYSGGEYFSENPDGEGLPALVAMASAQVVFDSATPEMAFTGIAEFDGASARITRPLDRLEDDVEDTDMPERLTPAFTENVFVNRGRWYFKELTGSLQKRLYFDSLRSKLVFRGRLNDLESGDPDLTATPVSLAILEANVMTPADYAAARGLATTNTWTNAIDDIYLQAQNPSGVNTGANFDVDPASLNAPVFLARFETLGLVLEDNLNLFSAASRLSACLSSNSVATSAELYDCLTGIFLDIDYQHLDSLGVGSALVPNSSLLTSEFTEPIYITFVENNHEDGTGAISLHTGDFGGNTADIYYQWWVREVANLDSIGLPEDNIDLGWQVYEEGLNLQQIEFSGRPDVMLSDNLFYVRYGSESELLALNDVGNDITDDLDSAVTTSVSWRLVDINDDTDFWTRSDGDPVPFQWAGAANSPQFQADGSFRFLPQLVMGWVKRILDRINPYEARYSDFYGNESPATYSSQIQIAGPPFNGKVALNSDKDVIEGVGLIELYETVLARAKELTIEIEGAATEGTNQALLLAATRLAFLYELLAREAYTDAQNSLIKVTEENGLGDLASYIHAFTNQQATLLDEELALLRGTDFLVAYPAFNRLFWNYVKGEGEAAYNANYNIYDVNDDGFINEFDAAILYPQGHGDSWGHFVSSNNMHYELLRSNAFDWRARSELYSLLDNIIQADYLDEKSFARIAAAKARAGVQITRGTYRRAYTANPHGQWQGYEDTDPARAWGVSEWARRTGQAALFDWMVGNAIVPADSDANLDNLDVIDRQANRAELSEIAVGLRNIQIAVDDADMGRNPVGFQSDAVVFDLDPSFLIVGSVIQGESHFEQVLKRAVQAAQNAFSTMELAARAEQQLLRLGDNTLALQTEALRQDLDYRNRLIAVFGRPYDGTIGPGQIYAEGYKGPDTLLYKYVETTDATAFIPDADSRFARLQGRSFSSNNIYWDTADVADYTFDSIEDTGAGWNEDIVLEFWFNRDFEGHASIDAIYDDFYVGGVDGSQFDPIERTIGVPVRNTSDYAFVAEASWGQRQAYGRIQSIINEMLLVDLEVKRDTEVYVAHVEKLVIMNERLEEHLELWEAIADSRTSSAITQGVLTAVWGAAATVEAAAEFYYDGVKEIGDTGKEFLPRSIGFSNDTTSVPRGVLKLFGTITRSSFFAIWNIATVTRALTEASIDLVDALQGADEHMFEEIQIVHDLVSELSRMVTEEEALRTGLGQHIQRLEILAQELQSVEAEGLRLLEEREAFNKILAVKTQRNRYRDMILRVSRNEVLTRYQDALDNALRYAWLAAKAYDYETSLAENDPAAPTTLLEDIVRTRNLGHWEDGEPQIGKGGLAEILAQLNLNFSILEGQLGLNNAQLETGKLSLRHELFRIDKDDFASEQRWRRALAARNVNDLWMVPEFRRFCRPFADPDDGPQPGLVINFPTEIVAGLNVFGRPLGSEDHAWSAANFATKIVSVGTWFEGYANAGLSITPRVYLVPVGNDKLRVANSNLPLIRTWNVLEQRVPVPFAINDSHLGNPEFIPSIDGFNGTFADVKRFGDFRAYHTSSDSSVDPDELTTYSRLIGRSVWNTRWVLIIPGIGLHADPYFGLEAFIQEVSDIKLIFETYSNAGS